MICKLLPAVGLTFGMASVASADNLTVMGVLTGKCKAAMAMDVSSDPSICMNKVVNVEFPNARVGFIFNLKKGSSDRDVVTISFFGDGRKQLHLDPDTAMQPIDGVHFTFQGSTDNLVAAGSCRFSNPFRGVPAKISCSADTNQGKFAGEFVSDGRAPDMTQTR